MSLNISLKALTRRAATAFGVRLVLVSYRGQDGRLHWKSGDPENDLIDCETFCAVAANSQGPMAIADTAGDATWSAYRNGAGAPHIGSFLAVPIAAETAGALCVFSNSPRLWEDADFEAARDFAAIAAALFTADAAGCAMDVARDGIAIADANGVFSYMNHAHAAQFGYMAGAELIGKSWTVLYDENNARVIAEEAFPAVAQAGVWTGETVGRRRDGSQFDQEITLSALPSGGIICATRDISERKALQAEALRLTEMRARAEAASAAKSVFLAQMSHEIRTPLNGVIGVAGALCATDLSSEQREMVTLLQSCGDTLEQLVSDILDLSQIESGKIKFDAEPFDLAVTIESAVRIVTPSARAKAIGIEVVCDEVARNAPFIGDAKRIKQLVLNLVSNAVKFTEAGKVRIIAAACADYVTIEVNDTGIGFEERDAPRLFQRFEQGDETIARKYGGTGLGLSICQALAEGMGGTIACESTPAVGSRFIVMLPLVRGSAPVAEIPMPVAIAQTGLRVLVAEDHLTNQHVIEIILRPTGAHLTFTANGEEVVEARKRGDFDLILMDMLMPVMDGIEAITAIRDLEHREELRRVPIVVLSANVGDRQKELARNAGADVYLAKPITPHTLLGSIEMALQGARAAA